MHAETEIVTVKLQSIFNSATNAHMIVKLIENLEETLIVLYQFKQKMVTPVFLVKIRRIVKEV